MADFSVIQSVPQDCGKAIGSTPVFSTKSHSKRVRFFILWKNTMYNILYSAKLNKYYIGQTESIERRIAEHNQRKNLGANDWILKYKETFDIRSVAMKREIEIKRKKRRSYIEWLISQ